MATIDQRFKDVSFESLAGQLLVEDDALFVIVEKYQVTREEAVKLRRFCAATLARVFKDHRAWNRISDELALRLNEDDFQTFMSL